tara:strand:+ start:117 stop:320 length:204 start_codon:yes stop_codon:yes gene_type:complete
MSRILVIFLVANALFWGLAEHSQHCYVANLIGFPGCVDHYVHLIMGVIFYLAAVYTQNKSYFDYLLS